MHWQYEKAVRETVEWFVSRAIPDSEQGWDAYTYAIVDMGKNQDGSKWWLVSFDIGTSVKGMDCWLSFKIVEPAEVGREAFVTEISAVRSGRGEHEYDTYVWDMSEDMWVTAPDDD